MRKTTKFGILLISLLLAAGNQFLKADLGIKAGWSLVNVQFSSEIPQIDFSSRSEFTVGAFFSLKILNNWYVQPEVYYLTKGVDGKEGDDEGSWQFTYFEIPVLIKFIIPMKGNVKPGIFAGPYLAFNTKAWEYETEDGITEEIDLAEFAEKTDFGLVFGGCLEYELGFGKLILDLRYTLGLVNFVKHLRTLTNGAMGSDDWVKNNTFNIMIGIGF